MTLRILMFIAVFVVTVPATAAKPAPFKLSDAQVDELTQLLVELVVLDATVTEYRRSACGKHLPTSVDPGRTIAEIKQRMSEQHLAQFNDFMKSGRTQKHIGSLEGVTANVMKEIKGIVGEDAFACGVAFSAHVPPLLGTQDRWERFKEIADQK